MISTTRLQPSGAIEVSALVRDTKTCEVWYERQAYYGYHSQDCKKLYRQHLRDSNLMLVEV
jgi:hypothetical protein